MLTQILERHGTPIASYIIASADMYYEEMNRRVIYVQDDPNRGFQIWAEIPGGGVVTAVRLCEVFLEYAMTCQAMGDHAAAIGQIEGFGKILGVVLAKYLKESTPLGTAENLGPCALECVFESMNAHFTIGQADNELHYTLDDSQLHETAERTGLGREVELAQRGIDALCHSIVNATDPELVVYTHTDNGADRVFSVKMVVGS